jgi:hypothetical protein
VKIPVFELHPMVKIMEEKKKARGRPRLNKPEDVVVVVEKKPKGRPEKRKPEDVVSEKRPRGRPRLNKPKVVKEKKPKGRKSLYRPEFIRDAYELALLGLTDAQIASHIGVSESLLNEWKTKYPEFFETLKKGKTMADSRVAKSLYERACGYEHPAVKIFNTPTGPLLVDYVERYPPDTQAASLWLRNRQPARWRDRVETTVTGQDGGPLEIKAELKISPEDAYLKMVGN